MISTPHPVQKLCCVSRTPEQPSFLLAAAGPNILSFAFNNGSLLSHGPPFGDSEYDVEMSAENSANGPSPAKRRRLDHSTVSREESEESVEIVAERRKGERRKPKVEDSRPPTVSHLIATSDGRKIIAVTTEDKTITVYSLMSSGRLIVDSQRSMPKRLCSVALTPDEQTIIAADKFGDVYSLPLHPSEDYVGTKHTQGTPNGVFQPSATELTVHTKGNLEALRQQQKQRKRNARKEGPDFEHKLILGHVSLLTDVAIATAEVSSRQRQFIITADRDEHVRISRYPQAHIIHGYCLGFRDFVSKTRIVPWNQRYLIVGSGEPSLKIFDWQQGRLLSQLAFDGQLQDDINKLVAGNDGERSPAKLAVSGIWPVQLSHAIDGAGVGKNDGGIVLVALEGMPAIFSFCFNDGSDLQHQQTIPLSGNALDLTVSSEEEVTAIVSIDNVHVPGSMMRQRSETDQSDPIIALKLDTKTLCWSRRDGAFSVKTNSLTCLQAVLPETQASPARSSRARGEYSALGELLYGLENLRKKRGVQAEDLDESIDQTEEVVPEETG